MLLYFLSHIFLISLPIYFSQKSFSKFIFFSTCFLYSFYFLSPPEQRFTFDSHTLDRIPNCSLFIYLFCSFILFHSFICSIVSFTFQNFLDAFCDAGETSFGCLMVYRKIAVATRRWWSLSATELVLLSMLATSATASSSSSFSSSPKCISQDIPIFLPDESPTVRY